MFEEIPATQWPIYAHLIAQDRTQTAEETRDSIEYMARFIDNKSVEEVQRQRKARESTTMPDDGFNTLLRHRFGRGISKFGPSEKSVRELGSQITNR